MTLDAAAGETLHEAREQFRRAFDDSVVGMAIISVDDRYEVVNRTLCTIVGRSESELLGIRPADITHPDDLAADRELIARLLAGDPATYRVEKRYLLPDGATVWVALHTSVVRDLRGRALYMIAQVEDISAARAARTAAARHESQLRTLAAALPIGIFRAEVDGRCLYANPRWREMYGFGQRDHIGREWLQRIHPDDVEQVTATSRASAIAGEGFASTFRVVLPDGDVRWLRTTANPVEPVDASDGGVGTFVGSVEDITDRVVARQHLAEATLRFQRAFDDAPIGMALVATDGRFIAVNQSLADLTGYAADHLVTMKFQDITHPLDVGADIELTRRVLAGEIDRYSLEKRYIHAGGRTVWVQLSVSLVVDESGAPLYFVSQIEDVTDRKLADEELVSYAERLARSNADLVEFASIAAHDLAEPLRVIEGYLDALQINTAGLLGSEARALLANAAASTTRLQQLVADLLAYARASGQRGEHSAVDLADVLAVATERLAVRIGETGATVSIGRLPVVPGDGPRLVQLFQNLLANALTFTRPNTAPVVAVSSAPTEEGWIVSVADNGIGIAPADRERVFAMFSRLDAAGTADGSGIGLAICRRVAEAHDGRVWIDDGSDGCTVRVLLPG